MACSTEALENWKRARFLLNNGILGSRPNKRWKRSYIDVVWKSRHGIEFAFEVRRKAHDLDLVTTVKDTNKLQNLIAKRKFVVNVSEITGRAYFCQIPNEPTGPVLDSNPQRIPRLLSRENEQRKSYSVAAIRQKHHRAYEKWTKTEDTELLRNFDEGLSISQLAEKHQRKQGAIRSRLTKLV